MMSVVELPPHIAVTAMLRAQRVRKKASRDWFDLVNERDWKAGKLKGIALYRFACEYEQRLVETGAFAIKRTGGPDRLRLRAPSGYQVDGKTLWPISLGQKFDQAKDAFAEDALALVRLGANFAANKVVAHMAPLNFCFTRHGMERLIERRAVAGDLATALTAATPDLVQDAAVTLACGIAKKHDEGDDWSRTAFLPFADGLLVLTNRLLTGPLYAEDFGWKFSFSKQHYSWSYLKKDLTKPVACTGSSQVNGAAVST